MNKIIFLILLSMIFSCAKQESEESVEIKTDGIFDGISFTIDEKEIKKEYFLGEFVNESDPLITTITIKNHTEFPMKGMKATFLGDKIEQFKFAQPEDADDEVGYPGHRGTCKKELSSKKTCSIKVQFASALSGEYQQKIKMDFTNIVEDDGKEFILKVLAGQPAFLVFDSGTSLFHFGIKTGAAQTPITERSIEETYVKQFVIRNAGELSARNMSSIMTQDCVSTESSACPAGHGSVAYAHSHNCPEVLKSGNECLLTMEYSPKNQDLDPGPTPDDIKEILYQSTFTLNYENDPHGSMASLNGYFQNVSTTIAAVMETSIDSLIYESPVVVGNRSKRSFKINNTGYVAGEIRKIIVKEKDSDDVFAICIDNGETDLYLSCIDPADYAANNLVEMNLDILPFYFKDKQDCMVQSGEETNLLAIDSGCIFEVMFQPSVNFVEDKSFAYDLYVEFDSRWQDTETIITENLHSIEADSLAAAKITVTSVKLASKTFDDPVDLNNDIEEFDLGRLALVSHQYVEEGQVQLKVRFDNSGSVSATDVLFRDGSGNTIPFSPSETEIGIHTPNFYTSVYVNAANCEEITAGSFCEIIMTFVPVGINSASSTEDVNENMFDYISQNNNILHAEYDKTENYKSFKITYLDGAIHTDGNRTDVVDIGNKNAEARIKANLVQKGLLQNITAINSEVPEISIIDGNIETGHILLRNIGTGPIAYMPALSAFTGAQLKFVTANAPYTGYDISADSDCLDYIDIEADADDTWGEINQRNLDGDWSAFSANSTCVLAFEFESDNRLRATNDNQLGFANLNFEKYRKTSFAYQGTDNIWNIKNEAYASVIASFDYYDGDFLENPELVGEIEEKYGKRFYVNKGQVGYDFNTLTLTGSVLKPADVIINSPRPVMSGILYRPSFVQDDLNFEASLLASSVNHAETYFYSTSTVSYLDNFYAKWYKAWDSQYHVSGVIDTYTTMYPDADFVLHAGTFPKNKDIKINFNLNNEGQTGAKLIKAQIDASAEFTLVSGEVDEGNSGTHVNLNTSDGTSRSFEVLFNANSEADYSIVLEYKFENGVFDNQVDGDQNIITKKIVIVAEALDDPPNIEVDLYDYTVSVNDPPLLPDVTMDVSPTALNLADEFILLSDDVTFSSVKIDDPTDSDYYVKKRIVIKNTSSTPMNNFSYFFGTEQTSILGLLMPVVENSCDGVSSLAAANAGDDDECVIEFFYQPASSFNPSNNNMIFRYELQPNQYVYKKLNIILDPKEPALVVPSSLSSFQVSTGTPGVFATSYALDLDIIDFDEYPKEVMFDDASGKFKRITLNNFNSESRASLLKAYHEHLIENDVVIDGIGTLDTYHAGNVPNNTLLPDPSVYTDREGISYAEILKTKYPDGEDRFTVEATESCFIGDDEGGIMDIEKGFYSGTASKCYINIIYNIHINFMGKTLSTGSDEDMNGNIITIPYYNNVRSSVSFIKFHILQTINPDATDLADDDEYINVVADETGSISFDWDEMVPNNLDLGPIEGYRVLRAESETVLLDPLHSVTETYTDVMNGTNFSLNGLDENEFYYFKVVPIRKHIDYNSDGSLEVFPDLNPGYYLSNSGIKTIRMIVPEEGMIYDHEKNILLNTELAGGVEPLISDYNDAKLECSTSNVEYISDATVLTPYNYKLITDEIWQDIRSDADLSDYPDYLDIPHWLDGELYSIDTVMADVPGFDPLAESQMLFDEGYVYFRKDSDFNAQVPKLGGGFFSEGDEGSGSDLELYIDAELGFGFTRCYIQLPEQPDS